MAIRQNKNFSQFFSLLGLFVIILIWFQQAHSQDMEFDWAIEAGGWDYDKGYGIVVGRSGAIFVTGYFRGTATFGSTTLVSAGNEDIFIVKVDRSGHFIWVIQAGGPGIDEGFGIAVDGTGNVFVTGHFQEKAAFGSTVLESAGYWDVFVAKVDSSGHFLWAKQAGGPDWDEGSEIAVDRAGNVHVTGRFQSTSTFGSTELQSEGDWDIFVAKVDGSGNFLWAVWAGGPVSDAGYGMAVDSSGNSFVTGCFNGTSTFGSNVLASHGDADIFVAKVDESGTLLWSSQAGGPMDDVGYGVAVNDSGNIFVTGRFGDAALFGDSTLTSIGTWDIFLAKVDGSGNFLWTRKAGGTGIDNGYGITVDGSGSVFLTGNFMGRATFGTAAILEAINEDIFITKIDGSGNFLWAKQAGGSDADSGQGIAVDDSGNVFVTGYFYSTAAFGSDLLSGTGEATIFICKMKPAAPHTTVNVTFHATVPATTPAGDGVYLSGNFNSWNPAGNAMTKTGTDLWETTLPFTSSQVLEFKYTRGSWATVEKGPQGEEIPHRTLTVPDTDCFNNDTVANWADMVSVDSGRPERVKEFRLCANYPNPFNPRTTIRFELPQASMVTLNVIDCLGREKAVLVNGELSAGVYEILFESKDLESGIFIYTMKIQDRDNHVVFKETRKGLILK